MARDAPDPVVLAIVLETRFVAAELWLLGNRMFEFVVCVTSEAEMVPLRNFAKYPRDTWTCSTSLIHTAIVE